MNKLILFVCSLLVALTVFAAKSNRKKTIVAPQPVGQIIPPMEILLPKHFCSTPLPNGQLNPKYMTVFFVLGSVEDLSLMNDEQIESIDAITGVITQAEGQELGAKSILTLPKIENDRVVGCQPVITKKLVLKRPVEPNQKPYNVVIFAIHSSPEYFLVRDGMGPSQFPDIISAQLYYKPTDSRLDPYSQGKMSFEDLAKNHSEATSTRLNFFYRALNRMEDAMEAGASTPGLPVRIDLTTNN